MGSLNQELYDPKRVDLRRLAKMIQGLSAEQIEALEVYLDPKAMKQLSDSKKDLERGDTVPIDEW